MATAIFSLISAGVLAMVSSTHQSYTDEKSKDDVTSEVRANPATSTIATGAAGNQIHTHTFTSAAGGTGAVTGTSAAGSSLDPSLGVNYIIKT